MNIGFGSLRQMADTLKYNRDLLGKKKSARDRYKEEIKKSTARGETVNLEEVRLRVEAHLKRGKVNQKVALISSTILITLLIGSVAWFLTSFEFTRKKEHIYKHKERFFHVSHSKLSDEFEIKEEFFPSGPKAAETIYKGRWKHHKSQSFYESGEPFRIATYFNDTLLTEVYFLKSGDTIRNMPVADTINIYHFEKIIENKQIDFSLFDGKIIGGSYKEKILRKNVPK
jgi:hypothetical protein